jgi:hypothetical protein
MKRLATLLVWLALLFGLPQVLICGVMIFSAGWLVAPLLLILLLVPLAPLMMQEIPRWQRLPPEATASVALLSIVISGAFYWMLYYRMR